MFNKVLIANRGEIAVRIIRSVRDAGYLSVAVYSEADAEAPHVLMADEAICIGPAQVNQSYLVIENIIDAARKTGADAIHPGYGFLSENDQFAQACLDAGIIFIGPTPEAIALMGNKRVAKSHMLEAGVPCIPGYQGKDQSDATLLKEAERIGFPLMVKAAAGGGGRGMRFLHEGADVVEAIKSARSESLNAFGSDELILERAVMDGRHIEVQVAGDTHGDVIYLGERDCSIQRRHQKVIEEAPSPFVDDDLRGRMGEAAVQAAKSCSYHGVGTVEFLVDDEGEFYFLEMNTRLQVEHPVTELVADVDLVDMQLQIAAGKPLPITQEDVFLDGHAIEARLYAEDPANGFMPQTGEIQLWEEAEGAGIRIDHGVNPEGEVSPHYDPMLAKVIAYGRNREEARRRLLRALKETSLLGVTTNKSFLKQILEDDRFVEGAATTSFIDDATLEKASDASVPTSGNLALAAILLQIVRADAQGAPWRWSNSAPVKMRVKLGAEKEDRFVDLVLDGTRFNVSVGDVEHVIELHYLEDALCDFTLDGIRQTGLFVIVDDDIYLEACGRVLHLIDKTYAPVLSEEGEGSGRIVATTEGLVINVVASEGERVEKGQTLVTIEAMKMEHRLLADGDGIVKSVSAQVNTQVKKGQLMVELELDNQTGENS